MFVALSQESTPHLKRAIGALIAFVQLTLDINLVDLALEWFWDGAGEAMPVLGDAFPGFPGHMCLQHSKVQQGRRFSGGFKHWAVRTLAMLAFLPNPLFMLQLKNYFDGWTPQARQKVLSISGHRAHHGL